MSEAKEVTQEHGSKTVYKNLDIEAPTKIKIGDHYYIVKKDGDKLSIEMDQSGSPAPKKEKTPAPAAPKKEKK